MLTDDNRLLPVLLSPALVGVIRADDPAHLAIFTVR